MSISEFEHEFEHDLQRVPTFRLSLASYNVAGMRHSSEKWKRTRSFILALLLCVTGCVERLLQVRSIPSPARVFINGKEVGTTPLDYSFPAYGGAVRIVLRREGYQSERQVVPLPTPWYAYPVLDLFSEVLVPWTINDHRQLDFELKPTSEEIRTRQQKRFVEKAKEAHTFLEEKKQRAEEEKEDRAINSDPETTPTERDASGNGGEDPKNEEQ